jgi:hypothetical protein
MSPEAERVAAIITAAVAVIKKLDAGTAIGAESADHTALRDGFLLSTYELRPLSSLSSEALAIFRRAVDAIGALDQGIIRTIEPASKEHVALIWVIRRLVEGRGSDAHKRALESSPEDPPIELRRA